MIKLTWSLYHYLWVNHMDKLTLIMFGHVEEITDEIWNDYIDWVKTEEGKSYLKGGSNYREMGEKNA